MRKRRKSFFALTAIAVAFMLSLSLATVTKAAEKQTIYNSPYVSFAPDGRAWTTHAGDSNIRTYPMGETVTTGIVSSIRELNEGEHYYLYDREGEVPISKWVVSCRGQCVHTGLQTYDYHGLTYTEPICSSIYFPGWLSYCADCGESAGNMLVYMSKEAAESLDYIETRIGRPMVETDMDYYYLCPFCTHLEMGAPLTHECKAISHNRYKVVYDRNHEYTPTQRGDMYPSYHYYNNATSYHGQEVTPVTHLSLNNFARVGYEFTGWNTKPDGSGVSFVDGAEILNLSSADFRIEDTWHVEADGQLDDGTVTLYAQWERSESTLRMHLAGGTYQGQSGPVEITQEFGTSYTIDMDALEAPEGYAVSFNTNGGTATDYESGASVSSIRSDKLFAGWKTIPPMKGQLSRNLYYFKGPDGSVDEIEATYGKGSIMLPYCEKEGYSFGGWYLDSALTRQVGGPGDEYTPTDDVTLYASWGELVLTSEDNYSANGGKGAVDLSWEQEDGADKVYKIYQSTDASTWAQVTSADEIGSISVPAQTIEYTGETEEYTVPYTGNYNISTYGAQGGKVETYNGGRGGLIYGSVYLDAGEKLTLNVGGQNGYNGGGDGDPFGNGGGASTVVSDKKGTLFIAGGGGGAIEGTDGEKGGAVTSLRSDGKSEGEDGGAGGGAGYVGGTAGEYEVHNCVDACLGLNVAPQSFYDAGRGSKIGTGYNMAFVPYTNGFAGGMTVIDHRTQQGGITYTVGSSQNYLSTPDTGMLKFSYSTVNEYGNGMFGSYNALYVDIKVYDKDTGDVVYSFDLLNSPHVENEGFLSGMFCGGYNCTDPDHRVPYKEWTYTAPEVTGKRRFTEAFIYYNHSGTPCWYVNDEHTELNFSIPIPERINGVYIGVNMTVLGVAGNSGHAYVGSNIYNASYSYATCGYEDGEVISSVPAYGGSNYIAEDWMNSFRSSAGSNAGDGKITISASSVGFVEGHEIEGVMAPDLASPERISEESVIKTPVGRNRVEISWETPEDNGTPYYHKVESYLRGSVSRLCTSNITLNTLTTGVKGYYYLVNANAATTVNSGNGTFISVSSVAVDVTDAARYLHVAAVDKAGNVGMTIHIRIQNIPEDPEEVILWNLSTGPITLEDTGYTHPAGTGKWYVKADGITPFCLMYDGFLEGSASSYYQPNYSIFVSQCESTQGENILFTESHAVCDTVIVTRAGGLTYSTKDSPILGQYPYMVTERSDRNTKLHTIQKFTLQDAYHGKEVTVYPRSGAAYGTEVVYSNETDDRLHKIVLIGDSEAPVIMGLEDAEGADALEILAVDALSGIGDFYVEVINTDINDRNTFYPEADGKVRINLSSGEPMFNGNLQIRAVATDNVGNEEEVVVSAIQFSMTTTIERILAPHDPVFRCGESGVLTITTYGYADRIVVEFPPELETENVYSTEFIYPAPAYIAEERLQFMVPLGAPSQEYVVKVTAYKNGNEMQRDEPIMVVSGTVLQELRTRLR